MAAAVVLGVVLSFLVGAFQIASTGGLAPTVFAILPAIALVWLGRLRWLGAAYLIVVVSLAFFAATAAAMYFFGVLHVSLCIFGCSEEIAASNIWKTQVVGAIGGMVGALVSFLCLTLLGPALRDRQALLIEACALPVLAYLGSIGISGTIPGLTGVFVDSQAPGARFVQNFVLLAPWQIAFGATLVALFRRHTPKARSPR